MMENTQERIDWTIKQLECRELQHRTFKRDRDEITLTITEVRCLVDSHGNLQITCKEQQAQLAALEAERTHLREALKQAQRDFDDIATTDIGSITPLHTIANYALGRVRKALQAKEAE